MLSLTSGVVVLGASCAGFWHFKPHGGVVHPLVEKPYFGPTVTLVLMTAFVSGIGLILRSIM